MTNKEWFKEAGFGMMIHWGLYSILGGEWRGKRMDYIGEWIMSKYEIPNSEYEKLADIFNPIYFDADEWVLAAKAAGMKYIVVTSKHHDGFALFHSKVDKYNVVDATPFKRDVIKELAEACARHGMKLGLYYSQNIDWHEPHGGGYDMKFYHSNHKGVDGDPGMSWDNDWDFPNRAEKNYRICFEKKIKPQVKEILTQYGDLCLIWFDVPSTIVPEQCVELKNMVRKYQPGCLINGRLGYGLGDYETPGDNCIAEKTDSEKLYETVGTMNDSWGYRPTDTRYKSVQKILEIKKQCADIGSNYMLNIGPDPLGRIPVPGIDILRGLAAKRST